MHACRRGPASLLLPLAAAFAASCPLAAHLSLTAPSARCCAAAPAPAPGDLRRTAEPAWLPPAAASCRPCCVALQQRGGREGRNMHKRCRLLSKCGPGSNTQQPQAAHAHVRAHAAGHAPTHLAWSSISDLSAGEARRPTSCASFSSLVCLLRAYTLSTCSGKVHSKRRRRESSKSNDMMSELTGAAAEPAAGPDWIHIQSLLPSFLRSTCTHPRSPLGCGTPRTGTASCPPSVGSSSWPAADCLDGSLQAAPPPPTPAAAAPPRAAGLRVVKQGRWAARRALFVSRI